MPWIMDYRLSAARILHFGYALGGRIISTCMIFALRCIVWHCRALGLYPSATTMLSSAVSLLPSLLQKSAFNTALDLGRMQLAPLVGAVGLAGFSDRLRRAVREVIERGTSLRLQYPREDLGFVYVGGAIASHRAANSASTDRNAPFTPLFAVGGRLPHCMLEVKGGSEAIETEAVQVSSLDLVGGALHNHDQSHSEAFVLLTPRTMQGRMWQAAAALVAARYSAVLLNVEVARSELGSATDGTAVAGTLAVSDYSGGWAALVARSSGNDTLVVRPDGHICAAWRSSDTGVVDASGGMLQPRRCLEELFSEVLLYEEQFAGCRTQSLSR